MTGRLLTLVRHGRPSAGFGEDLDPGLSPEGRAQADEVAAALAAGGGPRPVVTSPLRRARETAAPLAAHWGVTPVVDAAVGELPSPAGLGPAARGAWLRELLGRARWADVDPALDGWRSALLAAVAALPDGAVVFTHWVAINRVVAAEWDDDRVVCCWPDHASATVVRVEGRDRFEVVELGRQGRTVVS